MSNKMVGAHVAEPAANFAARLARRARVLGEARAAALLLARRGGGKRRWREARLLWPSFTRNT